MRRFLATALLVTGAALPAAATAVAQRADVAAGLREDPLYVEREAEQVDRAAVEESVAAAAGLDLDLRVAVLADGDGEALANRLLDELPGTTVVVFTPSSYGVASDEISPRRLSAALAPAEDELSGPDAAAGLAALVDALRGGGGPSPALVVLGVLAVLLVVGVAGRVWETRTRARRQARRRDRRRHELLGRVSGVGQRIVALTDRVDLAESPDASAPFATAVAIFDEADRRLAAAATMHDLDAIEADLERAERLLDEASGAAQA